MRRSLSYVDAARMLGGGENAVVRALDRISGAGLNVAGFDIAGICREIVRLGDRLVTHLNERLQGMDRMTRTDRLRAAQAIIVITAYFEVLDALFAELPALSAQQLSTSERIHLAGGSADAGLRGFVEAFSRVDPTPPAPHLSPEAMRATLGTFYSGLSGRVEEFLEGLAGWHGLSQAQRSRLTSELGASVPSRAVNRYEELFRQLANDCPEFAIWAHMADHQATRAELRTGLAELESLLQSIARGRAPDHRRAALARRYRVALERPIAPAGEAPADLIIPTLGEGYVDHRFRAAEVTAAAEPGHESWWKDVPKRKDVCSFLAGYLLSPEATEAPMILLGQPGSGKSVLTRILAARLPATDFLPVRVELRQVPAESDLQAQIEFAIRDATGESVTWPRLVESADGALPVVLLDGFDELLQATGVSQTDFLLRVLAFQEREADQGRPVAVIVTSRTAVTDRARIPHGAVAVRLEPFDDSQVACWLAVWRRDNAAVLGARGLRPLPADMALRHQELAEQPLLLLMLALYDADANALQDRSAELGSTELYGRLLKEFARREIRKHASALTETDLQRAVEAELLRLSVIAFAMFNRRSQWVAEGDLDADLSALLGGRRDSPRGDTMRAGLTAAQLAVGRFFFVHESQATRDNRRLQTYEFLHATFGEFLVARLVDQVLADMLARESASSSPLRGTEDGLLHALLSFAVLTARAPIVAFLSDLLNRADAEQRAGRAGLLLRLHSAALYPRTDNTFSTYEPLRLTVTARHAAWSTNLAVLAVLTAGEITGSQLFPHDSDPAASWRNQAMMWRSQLTSEEAFGLHEFIAVDRLWDGPRRDLRLRRLDPAASQAPTDIYWTYNIPPDHPDRRGIFAWGGHNPPNLQRKSNFFCGKSDDFMTHGLLALGRAFPSVANVFVTLPDSRPASATSALLAALVAPYTQGDPADSAYHDLAYVAGELAGASNVDRDYDAYLKTALTVLLSAVELEITPASTLQPLSETLAATADDSQMSALIARLHAALRRPATDKTAAAGQPGPSQRAIS